MNDEAYPRPHPDCRCPHRGPREYNGPTHQGTEPDRTKEVQSSIVPLPETEVIPDHELHSTV